MRTGCSGLAESKIQCDAERSRGGWRQEVSCTQMLRGMLSPRRRNHCTQLAGGSLWRREKLTCPGTKPGSTWLKSPGRGLSVSLGRMTLSAAPGRTWRTSQFPTAPPTDPRTVDDCLFLSSQELKSIFGKNLGIFTSHRPSRDPELLNPFYPLGPVCTEMRPHSIGQFKDTCVTEGIGRNDPLVRIEKLSPIDLGRKPPLNFVHDKHQLPIEVVNVKPGITCSQGKSCSGLAPTGLHSWR